MKILSCLTCGAPTPGLGNRKYCCETCRPVKNRVNHTLGVAEDVWRRVAAESRRGGKSQRAVADDFINAALAAELN